MSTVCMHMYLKGRTLARELQIGGSIATITYNLKKLLKITKPTKFINGVVFNKKN